MVHLKHVVLATLLNLTLQIRFWWSIVWNHKWINWQWRVLRMKTMCYLSWPCNCYYCYLQVKVLSYTRHSSIYPNTGSTAVAHGTQAYTLQLTDVNWPVFILPERSTEIHEVCTQNNIQANASTGFSLSFIVDVVNLTGLCKGIWEIQKAVVMWTPYNAACSTVAAITATYMQPFT